MLAGKDVNLENGLQLMHQAILYANLIGGPKVFALDSKGELGAFVSSDYNPKRMKFDLSEWEMKSLFDPSSIDFKENKEVWVDYRGRVLLPPFSVPRAEEPESFIAGNLHKHLEAWRELNPSAEVLEWLENGVNIENYFRHFKGNFKGKMYDSCRLVLPKSYDRYSRINNFVDNSVGSIFKEIARSPQTAERVFDEVGDTTKLPSAFL
ncbi:unnamed protein product [Mytilus edulis]|uniref:Uncharacterized protein n=1 Tax=Mytilus edulis TaxID=6550 RepID=A0A8S3QX12_MYTED|nr:unnamed protein product [Mytilus edulis]